MVFVRHYLQFIERLISPLKYHAELVGEAGAAAAQNQFAAEAAAEPGSPARDGAAPAVMASLETVSIAESAELRATNRR